MIESNRCKVSSFRAATALLIVYVTAFVVFVFMLGLLYRFDNLIKAMAAYDLLVTISVMFLILLPRYLRRYQRRYWDITWPRLLEQDNLRLALMEEIRS